MMMWWGLRTPVFSASSMMYLTIRSFSEPDGFQASIFMRTAAIPGSTMRRRGMRGVLPIVSRTRARAHVCSRSARRG